MKIRSGFVSNSSTSSFVCIGVNIPDLEDLEADVLRTIMDKYGIKHKKIDDDELAYTLKDGLEEKFDIRWYNETTVVGHEIASCGSDDVMEESDVSIDDLVEIKDKLVSDLTPLAEILGVELDVRLYTGIEGC